MPILPTVPSRRLRVYPRRDYVNGHRRWGDSAHRVVEPLLEVGMVRDRSAKLPTPYRFDKRVAFWLYLRPAASGIDIDVGEQSWGLAKSISGGLGKELGSSRSFSERRLSS